MIVASFPMILKKKKGSKVINMAWVQHQEGSGSAIARISPRTISVGLMSWMPDGVSDTESHFLLGAGGCFRSTMNATADRFLALGGRLGPGPHSDGCFFRGMLPVL